MFHCVLIFYIYLVSCLSFLQLDLVSGGEKKVFMLPRFIRAIYCSLYTSVKNNNKLSLIVNRQLPELNITHMSINNTNRMTNILIKRKNKSQPLQRYHNNAVKMRVQLIDISDGEFLE